MSQKHQTLQCSQLEVLTVDGYQGKENRIAILGLVVTESRGFLSMMNRLVVASSRAQDGLYVIGQKMGIDNTRARYRRFLKRYQSQLLTHRYYLKGETRFDFYKPGDLDLLKVVDPPRATESEQVVNE